VENVTVRANVFLVGLGASLLGPACSSATNNASGNGQGGTFPAGTAASSGVGGVGASASQGGTAASSAGGAAAAPGSAGGAPGNAGGTVGAGAGPASTGGVVPPTPQGAGGQPGVCGTTFRDCNGNSADDCETNVNSDPGNCGACGTVCPGAPHATPYCFVGQCAYACEQSFGDCNGKPEDGCEVNLLNDKQNCGACRISCGDTECSNGGCQCAGTSVEPKKIPLDMYIVFDQSGSMKDMVTGGTKWDVIKGALSTFAQNGASAGISVGLGYFPAVIAGAPTGCTVDADCGNYGPCTGGLINGNMHFLGVCAKADQCQPGSYQPDVAVGALPGVATAIVNSLGGHSPGGGTPTYPAMQGGYDYTKMWAAAHPDHKTILVLATDGDPSGCDPTTNNVGTIATNLVTPAQNGTPPILTFVIGVGNSLGSLNQIASAGGTGMAFIVDTAGADPGGQFLAAMKQIEGSPALGCQYTVPVPPMGAADFSKVNVQLTPPGGSVVLLKRVNDAASCTPTDGGWHYDNNTTPTQIILCDSTCGSINAATDKPKVDVVLGCASIG
jgi:hypothetical protein